MALPGRPLAGGAAAAGGGAGGGSGGGGGVLLIRDPCDDPGVVRCTPPAQLDGRQHMMCAVVRGGGIEPMAADECRRRGLGEPQSVASWIAPGRWKTAED